MRASVDEVQRVTARRGDRLPLRQGRHHRAGAQPGAARRGLARSTATRCSPPPRPAQRLRATRTLGATYTPDCAAIHPGRLVRGLAEVVTRRGVALHERTPALGDRAGRRAHDPRVGAGAVRRARDRGVHAPAARAGAGGGPGLLADHRVRAAVRRGLGRDRPGAAGDVLGPPAPDHLRAADRRRPAGLRRPRCAVPPRVADLPRPSTATRGSSLGCTPRCSTCSRCCTAPGSRTPGAGRSASRATGAPRWGWTAATGLAWAGGYVGDGVSTTNLAGRTLCDLILDRSTELTALPWVGHRSPAWEPEPLRWLGINAGLRAMTLADAEETLTGRPSLIARVMAPLVGGHSVSEIRCRSAPWSAAPVPVSTRAC